MTTTLNNVLISAALSSLMVTACDRPQGTDMIGQRSLESAEHSNTRCLLIDGQEVCASSRMREPIHAPPSAVL